MKLLIGILVSFSVGVFCRYFDIPVGSPPVIPGALLVVAMTLGYSGTDKLLQAKINSVLAEHISITDAPNGVAVSVAGGKVILAGTCSNGSVRAKAEKAARGIAGVGEIDNRIVSVPAR